MSIHDRNDLIEKMDKKDSEKLLLDTFTII